MRGHITFPKFCFRSAHYWISTILLVAVLPLLCGLHLPLSYDWNFFLPVYWLVLPVESAFCAVLLLLLAVPWKSTGAPLLHRMQKQPLRIICVATYFLALLIALSLLKALVITITTIALLELVERTKPDERKQIAGSILVPALYLFVGLLLVFSYNDIIITIRFFGKYDPFFNSMDKWLLHGATVSSISQAAIRAFPISFFRFFEFVYYSLFALLGAGIFLTGINFGRPTALRYIGTILTAYYISMACFLLWPSQGPQYLSIIHGVELPSVFRTHSIQVLLLAKSRAISTHAPLQKISSDYYIGFPCMHITQSLILTWFLKPWKRMVWILGLYNVLLLVAIILLEWHYVVDIIAGVAIAIVAVILVGKDSPAQHRDKPPSIDTISPLQDLPSSIK